MLVSFKSKSNADPNVINSSSSLQDTKMYALKLCALFSSLYGLT
jgi:hypothetical protein